MLDVTKTAAAMEAARQLVTTLAPHVKALASHARPLVASAPRRALAPTLGVFGLGLAVGAGVGLFLAPNKGAELRSRLKGWYRERLSPAGTAEPPHPIANVAERLSEDAEVEEEKGRGSIN